MNVSTICLNMIVKDEANIIVDTLNNIRSCIQIDHVVICDTGSNDETVNIIRSYLDQYQIAGEIYQHVWQDFAHNRNLALELCAGKSDYVLIFDADDRFVGDINLPQLTHDIYYLDFKSAEREFFYQRNILIKNKPYFRWVGVLHEALMPIKENLTEFEIKGNYYIQTGHFGARSQDHHKYLKDAETLVMAFEQETNSQLKARYAYYCATSFYSAEQIDQAIIWFEQRINYAHLTTDHIETYLACRHLGSIYKNQGRLDRAAFIWLKGCNVKPYYLECFYELSLLYSDLGDVQIGYDFAMLGKQKQLEEGAAAFEKSVEQYGLDFQILKLGRKFNQKEATHNAWQNLMKQPFYSQELTSFLAECIE